jgi:hypothetical protein
LIAHVAKTRELEAGSIVGSGTVSNKQGGLFGSSVANGGVGYCCIAELRMYETIEGGTPATPFMRFGDRVKIEMLDGNGASVFGAIDQVVERYTRRPDRRRTSPSGFRSAAGFLRPRAAGIRRASLRDCLPAGVAGSRCIPRVAFQTSCTCPATREKFFQRRHVTGAGPGPILGLNVEVLAQFLGGFLEVLAVAAAAIDIEQFQPVVERLPRIGFRELDKRLRGALFQPHREHDLGQFQGRLDVISAVMLAAMSRQSAPPSASPSGATGADIDAGARFCAGRLRSAWPTTGTVASICRSLAMISCKPRSASTPLMPARHSMRRTARSSSATFPVRRMSRVSERFSSAGAAAASNTPGISDSSRPPAPMHLRQHDVNVAKVIGIGSRGAQKCCYSSTAVRQPFRRSRPRQAPMKLYSYFRSSASFRVRIALALKGLDYEYARCTC